MTDCIEATYLHGSALPDLWASWRDASGALVQFATDPHTFSLVVENRNDPGTTALTKAAGFVGYDTEPNLRIGWLLGDLPTLDPGTYDGLIVAVRDSDSLPREMPFVLNINRTPGMAVNAGPASPPS